MRTAVFRCINLRVFSVLICYFTEDEASDLVMDLKKPKILINHIEVKRDSKQNGLQSNERTVKWWKSTNQSPPTCLKENCNGFQETCHCHLLAYCVV